MSVTVQHNILVLGATGRIGGVLRTVWGASGALWQTREDRAGPDWVTGGLLEGQEAALIRTLTRAGGRNIAAVLCLAGGVNGRGDVALNRALGEAAVRVGAGIGAPVLLASSAAVYGRAEGLLTENRPLAPENAYGQAKAEMEASCAPLGAALGVPVCALRIGNIAGLDAILGGWRAGFELDRFSDGRTPRRSYIGVETLARVLGVLAQKAGDLPPVLNIAAPGGIEMGALLNAADLDWQARPAPPEAIPEVALDVTLLQGICPLDPMAGQPGALVAEWHRVKKQRTGEAT